MRRRDFLACVPVAAIAPLIAKGEPPKAQRPDPPDDTGEILWRGGQAPDYTALEEEEMVFVTVRCHEGRLVGQWCGATE